MVITKAIVKMTNWNIPLMPRAKLGYSGENAVCDFIVKTIPEENYTYYLELLTAEGAADTILLTADTVNECIKVNLTSEMLGASGIKKAQIVAYIGTEEEPIKKSNVFELEVDNSINATKRVESHYQTALSQWSKELNTLLNKEATERKKADDLTSKELNTLLNKEATERKKADDLTSKEINEIKYGENGELFIAFDSNYSESVKVSELNKIYTFSLDNPSIGSSYPIYIALVAKPKNGSNENWFTIGGYNQEKLSQWVLIKDLSNYESFRIYKSLNAGLEPGTKINYKTNSLASVYTNLNSEEWEEIAVVEKGLSGTKELLSFNDLQIPLGVYKELKICFYLNISSNGVLQIFTNNNNSTAKFYLGTCIYTGKKFYELKIQNNYLRNVNGTGTDKDFYMEAFLDRTAQYNYGQRINYFATNTQNIRVEDIYNLKLDIGHDWTNDRDVFIVIQGKRKFN